VHFKECGKPPKFSGVFLFLLEFFMKRNRKSFQKNLQRWSFIILIIFGVYTCTNDPNLNNSNRIGINSIQEIAFFENHYKSYITWIEKKPKSKTVIHFDSHIDIAPMPSSELEKIVSAVNIEEIEQYIQHPYSYYIPDEKFLTVANWLYPAMRSDIINTVIWVVPDDTLTVFWLEDLKIRFRNYFNNLSEEDIASFHFQGSIIKGIMYNVEVIITPIADIPQMYSPVLLDFDIDYYNFNSALDLDRLSRPKHHPFETINILKNKNIVAEVVTISTSIPNGYTSLSFAHLAEELRCLLEYGKELPIDYYKKLKNSEKGDSCMVEGNYDAAIHYYKSSLDGGNPNAGILFNLSIAETEIGEFNSSKDHYNKAIQLDSAFENPLLNKFNTYFYDKEYSKVKQVFELIKISDIVTTPWMKYKYASALFSLGEYKLAAEELNKLLNIRNEDSDIVRMLGYIMITNGNDKQGLSLYQQALTKGGENIFILLELARYHFQRGDLLKADQYLFRALKSNPHSSLAHYEGGRLAAAKKDFILAEKEFLEAIRLLPTNQMARYALARIYQKIGKLSFAEKSYKEFLEFNNQDVQVMQDLGLLMVSQRRFGEARKLLEQAVDLQPDLMQAHGNLGVLYLQIGQFSKAKKEFTRVVEFQPNDAFGWYNLSLAELKLDHKSEAIKYLNFAIAKGGQKFREMAKYDKNFSSIYNELFEP
jgi:tetratricopeptide (TPR) repeat protein